MRKHNTYMFFCIKAVDSKPRVYYHKVMQTPISLDDAIRKIPDFPKPGILFYDITGILINPPVFKHCIDTMVEMYKNKHIDAVAAIESRGFVFAAPFAERMGIPLILIRKKGKLPGRTYSCKYKLEYGEAELEVQVADVKKGQTVLVLDDLIATGGTFKAAKTILEAGGAHVKEFFGVVGLPFLNYKEILDPTPVRTLVEYNVE